MHNAFTEGVDLQCSIRCQLTKPADKSQHCVARTDTGVESDAVDEMHSFIAIGLFHFRVAEAHTRLKAHLIGSQSIRVIEITNVFQFYAPRGS